MTKNIQFLSFLISCFLLVNFFSFSQSFPSSELYHRLLRLQETKRILYVAAHPDDENTRLIAYLVNGASSEVAYLSLTRGDGGQNLIGKELGIGLGQIRTQELLKARETDGGRQYFTRAMDFGYSKNPDETLQNWDKEKVLSDVVWVIRKFQPDIIITRFNTIPGVTHGHHTTSAILAGEAFDLAGDPKAFPDQLNYGLSPWQPKRIFWNSYNFGGEFKEDSNEVYDVFETGEFNPLLGETYSQIAADSRTMHKSQGFGATAGIGEAMDHIQFIKGEPFENSAFDGVKDRWEQIEGGKSISEAIAKVIQDFDFQNTSKNVPSLLKIKSQLNSLKNPPFWIEEKKSNLDQLIFNALGLEFEFNARTELGYANQEISSVLVFNNPSEIAANNISLKLGEKVFESNSGFVSGNNPLEMPISITIPEDIAISQPYWLEKPRDGALYTVRNREDIGKPFNDKKFGGTLSFSIDEQKFEVSLPLMYKFNDQVDGEIKQPFTIVPEVDLTLSKETVFLIPGSDPKLKVTVHFKNQFIDGGLDFINLPADQYKILTITDNAFLKERVYEVEFVPNGNGLKEITARYVTSQGKTFDQITNRILYKHIPNLTYFQPATIRLIQEDWKVSGAKVGYIPGAGDDIPGVLTSLGYQVEEIGEADYSVEKLSQYKAIVVGIRAYNTNETLASNQQVLMGYVRSGGNVVVQYNTSSPLLTNQLGPYPFTLSRTRVAVEGAPITADWGSPILTIPNKVEESDFEGWVQERGLYFVGQMDEKYQTPFTMNDPEEDPSNGALIYAKYGEGTYTYTGISFFRQLPAGVPGAIKLFINLIEQ
jgi:LmbE family N-acetylglucosaminyl deacetylase